MGVFQNAKEMEGLVTEMGQIVWECVCVSAEIRCVEHILVFLIPGYYPR
jgi:hypothetical protein